MSDLKKINCSLHGLVLLLVTLFWAACASPPSPNPVIALEEEGISITVDSLADVSSVTIYSFNGAGQPLDTINATPGEAILSANAPEVPRPIRFNFIYKSSSGNTIVEDMLSVHDGPDSNGVLLPDMDVVIGRLNNSQQCPSSTQIATGTGVVTFNFQANKRYEVRMTHPGGQEERLLLHPKPAPPNVLQAGKVDVYKTESYSCMTNPPASNPNIIKQLEVGTVHNTHCTITGLDSVDATYYIRRITVSCSSDSCTFSVRRE